MQPPADLGVRLARADHGEQVATWRKAVDLKPGDSLVAANGSKFAVVSTTTRMEYRKVYNLTVNGLHTVCVPRNTSVQVSRHRHATDHHPA
ncbi:polymorphic toxin-type HINT domain-containing protein [Lentzea waywayandensis]|uniref:polymorphic toxin-type HINT domain-containing protein n=1 Tax=Lentzea waywayandensis TaxID=84724 RepID=UPI000B87CA63